MASVGSLNKHSLNISTTRSIANFAPSSPLNQQNITFSQFNTPSTSTTVQETPLTYTTTFTSKKNINYKSRLNTSKNLFEGTQTPQAVHEVVAAVGSSLTTKNFDENLSNKYSLDEDVSNSGANKLERLTKAWIRDYCIMDPEAITSKGDMYVKVLNF